MKNCWLDMDNKEADYIYMPFIPLITTPVIVPDEIIDEATKEIDAEILASLKEERRVFYVNVPEGVEGDSEKFLERMKEEFKKQKELQVDQNQNKITDYRISEDVASFRNLTSRESDDLTYFKNNLMNPNTFPKFHDILTNNNKTFAEKMLMQAIIYLSEYYSDSNFEEIWEKIEQGVDKSEI